MRKTQRQRLRKAVVTIVSPTIKQQDGKISNINSYDKTQDTRPPDRSCQLKLMPCYDLVKC